MQRGLAVGDEVMLTSGIFGTVRALDDDTVSLEVADGVTLRVVRAAVGTWSPTAAQSRDDEHGARRATSRRRSSRWHATSARPGRTVTVFFIGLAVAYGLVALDRHLEARARPRPRGRHPDHADRQGQRVSKDNLNEAADIIDEPRQRLGCHRGRGHHPGQQPDRGPGARRTEDNLVETVVAPGAAPLPPGRAGAADAPRRAAAASGAVARPVARRRRDAAAGDRAEAPTPSRRQARAARTARRRSSARTRPPRTPKPPRRRPPEPELRRPAPAAAATSPTSHQRGDLHRGEPEGAPGRPHLDDQPRPAVGGGLQRLHLPVERSPSSTTRPSRWSPATTRTATSTSCRRP